MPGKRVQFDQETWNALDLLARDSMRDFRELADEAFAALRHPPEHRFFLGLVPRRRNDLRTTPRQFPGRLATAAGSSQAAATDLQNSRPQKTQGCAPGSVTERGTISPEIVTR
jgi:hypothetical protein